MRRNAFAIGGVALITLAACGSDSAGVSTSGPLGPVDDAVSMCMDTATYSTFSIGNAYFQNTTSTPIEFESIVLRDADGVDLGAATFVPVIPPEPLVGVMGNYPPTFDDDAVARRWAKRTDVAGFRLDPDAAVNVVLEVKFNTPDASADGFRVAYRHGDSRFVFDNSTRIASGAACDDSSR